jgi:starvation-inducible outer membrane lipoprotein
MLKQLALVLTASLALAACTSAPPPAKNEKVAVQSAKPSDADYDTYMQGMIDSDAKADQGGEAN